MAGRGPRAGSALAMTCLCAAVLLFGPHAAKGAVTQAPVDPLLAPLVASTLHRLFPTANASDSKLLADVMQAAKAFMWAFPLVNTAPNFVKNGFTRQSDMNTFIWQYTPNNASFNSIVTPNVNVLYGPGFFDLTRGSIVLTVPDTASRYYVLQCMDFWGFTFARIGFTTTGTAAGSYTLVGPDHRGPIGQNVYRSPTSGVWVMGRMAVINQNASDIAIDDGLLEKFTVSAPSFIRKGSSPIFSSTTEAAKLWDDFSKTGNQKRYWEAYTKMVQYNKPLPSMLGDLASFKPLGVTAKGVTWRKLTAAQKQLLNMGTSLGWTLLQETSTMQRTTNTSSGLITWTGWSTSPAIGSTNTSILATATVAQAYVAANIPAEAVYWNKFVDNCGTPFKIGSHYVFNLTSRPPYDAFWSLTLYNTSNFYLIPTTNNTYSLGSQFPQLQINAQGGAALYLSQAVPKDPAMRSNWLPLGLPTTKASDTFYFIFRIYAPTSADVVYWYAPPQVQLVDADFKPLACPP